MKESIFKAQDLVYHWAFGKGNVYKVDNSNESEYPVEVIFDDRKDDGCHLYENFTIDGRFVKGEQPTLSFTPYDLANGGFSQERPKPELKEGQMIWVKENDDIEWYVRPFRNDTMINKSTIDIWDEYSILNPYPDSIEAKAIDIIRNIERFSCVNGNDFGIEDFLKEIDSYEK